MISALRAIMVAIAKKEGGKRSELYLPDSVPCAISHFHSQARIPFTWHGNRLTSNFAPTLDSKLEYTIKTIGIEDWHRQSLTDKVAPGYQWEVERGILLSNLLD